MSGLIWVDDLLQFKIERVFANQYLCMCSEQYKEELGMTVGSVIFIKDSLKPSSYKRLGPIKAIDGRKIIVGVMGDIGVGSQNKMTELHNASLSGGVNEEEIENDGLYGGRRRRNRKSSRKSRKTRRTRRH